MSPLALRRYRAERLLRDQFSRLRARVLAGVRRQLRASGVHVDQSDLEACYAQAWQGLYATMLEGRPIDNPAAWLMVVTFRRAIEEHRSRPRAELRSVTARSAHGAPAVLEGRPQQGAAERDLAAELDDRMRLRRLFEGLRSRLDAREREAATLCYLQGLSRSQAAARMGVSQARMRKLMDGRGAGQPGVAGKVGALVTSIRDGDWCDEQGSLMRALAYGVLDPAGERHRLALMHHDHCPACRAYVVSLRGLAAALPPVLLPWALGAGVLAAGEGARGAGVAAASGAGAGAGASGAGTGAAGGASAGAAGGAAGVGGAAAGGAGGGWLLAGGPLGAKLAVGCMIALGIGAGCVVLEGGHHAHGRPRSQASQGTSRSLARDAALLVPGEGSLVAAPAGAPVLASSLGDAGKAAARAPLSRAARASREFGPEQAPAASVGSTAALVGQSARAASAGSEATGREGRQGSVAGEPAGAESSGAGEAPTSAQAPGASSPAGDSTAAEREFAPG